MDAGHSTLTGGFVKAVQLHAGQLSVVEIPTPEPGPGQVLVRVTRSGICGSDLHARVHADASADTAAEVGYSRFMRLRDHVVMGHEFTGVVVAYGPKTRKKWKPGTPVVALPILKSRGQVDMTGLSEHAPGAYAEYVLTQEAMTLEVPDGANPDGVAMTEPLSVALHAVRRGEVRKKDVAIVIGCGPIGLAVILMLKAEGVRTVVASDYSAGRRELARACGADVVVDPSVESPWTAYDRPRTHQSDLTEFYGEGIDALRRLRRVPGLPWWKLTAKADRLGQAPRGPVVFECVGVPGIVEDIITNAPMRSRVVVVGVCMEPDTFRPTMAINKELDLRFVFAYEPHEFREVLLLIASGEVDPSPLHTATVGLDGVAAAFEALGDAETHAKILINPASDVTHP